MTVKRNEVLMLYILLAFFILACSPVAAESTLKEVRPGDMVFLYEEHLNLKAMRNPATDNPITSLRLYVNENPAQAMLLDIPVADDTDVTLDHVLLEENPGVYYTYNEIDGPIARFTIAEQELTLDITLAAPEHGESLQGLWIPEGTPVAFEICSPLVGTVYYKRSGGEEPAKVSIIITDENGRESSMVGTRDLRSLVIDEERFYTDDDGRPGPVSLDQLDEGKYTAQAVWVAPYDFRDARDSGKIHFIVGEKVGIGVTPTPTPTPFPTTEVPTEEPTEVPTANETAVNETLPTETPTPLETVETLQTPKASPVPTSAAQDSLPFVSGTFLFLAVAAAVCAIPVITLIGRSVMRRRKD